MAGDWMKIELELPDKPEVHAIAGTLNIDPDAVVGKLIRVWQWFDKHTTDGNAYGVTYSLADRISGVTGFGEAMSFVGWLEQQDKHLVMPKFDRHTSASAKTRALTAKRVANHKTKTNADGNADTVNGVVSDALPKEEKRRDKYIPPISPELLKDFLQVRKAKRAGTLTETAFKGIIREAGIAGISTEDAVRICCERNWVSFKANWDWQSASLGSERKRELSL
jgi:hypothetical protein